MSAADVGEVTRANYAYYAALQAGDIGAMQRVWDDDEAVVCVHPGWPLLRGRGRVLRSCSMIMANTAYLQFLLSDVAVRVDGDTAVVTCSESLLAAAEAAPPDAVPQAATVATTNVFRRGPQGWRMVVHHASLVLAGEEPGEGPG